MNAARIPTMASNLDAGDEKRALTSCALGEAHREASFRRMLRIGGGAALIAIGLIFLILGISGAGAAAAQPAPAGADSTALGGLPAPADTSVAAVSDTGTVSSASSTARGPYVSLVTGLLLGLISLAFGAAGIYFGLQIGAPAIEKVERGSWRFFVHNIGTSGRGLADALSCSEHNHSKVSVFELPDGLPSEPFQPPSEGDPEIAVVRAVAVQKKQLEAVEVRAVANAFIAEEGLLAEIATLAERAALGQGGDTQLPEALGTLSGFAAQQEQTQKRLDALGKRFEAEVQAVGTSLKGHLQNLGKPYLPSAGALPKVPELSKPAWDVALNGACGSLQAEIAPQTTQLKTERSKAEEAARGKAEEAKKKALEIFTSSGGKAPAEAARKAHNEAKQAASALKAKQEQQQAKQKQLEQLKAQPAPAEAEAGAPDNLSKMAALQGEIEALQSELTGLEVAKQTEEQTGAALKEAEKGLAAAELQRAAAEKAAQTALEAELESAAKACEAAVAQLEKPVEALKKQASELLQMRREIVIPAPLEPPQGMLERSLQYRAQALESVHASSQQASGRLEQVLQETRAVLQKAQLSGQSFPFQSLDVPVYRVSGNFGSGGGSWERTYVPGEYEGMADSPSFHALPSLLQRIRTGLSTVPVALEQLPVA